MVHVHAPAKSRSLNSHVPSNNHVLSNSHILLCTQSLAGLKAEGDLFEMIKQEVQRDATVRKRRASGALLASRPCLRCNGFFS